MTDPVTRMVKVAGIQPELRGCYIRVIRCDEKLVFLAVLRTSNILEQLSSLRSDTSFRFPPLRNGFIPAILSPQCY